MEGERKYKLKLPPVQFQEIKLNPVLPPPKLKLKR